MSGIYGTGDYIRDSFIIIDWLFNFFSTVKKNIQTGFENFLNSDFEDVLFRVLSNLPYGIFIIFLGFFLVVGVLRATEKGNGLKVYKITTLSMQPAIPAGSLVFSYPAKKYKVGDIINYKEVNPRTNTYTGRVLTHRIIETRIEEGFYAHTGKGDNNEHPDPGEIRTPDITGRVILILPILGYIDYLVRTIPGFIIFIGIPSILLIKEAREYLKEKSN